MAEGARKLRHINGLRQVSDEGRSASSRPWLLSKSSRRSRKLHGTSQRRSRMPRAAARAVRGPPTVNVFGARSMRLRLNGL